MAHDPSGTPAPRRCFGLRDLAGPHRARLLRWRRPPPPRTAGNAEMAHGALRARARTLRAPDHGRRTPASRSPAPPRLATIHPSSETGPTATTAAGSIPATASSSSSSARATGWPTPPPWPSPSSPARPTTRSFSTRRPGWARPTCCTRSAITSLTTGAAPPCATRRPSPSPTTSSARSAPGRSRASSTPTATPTFCSSTTFSSWPARPAPRRSSFTPSTRSTSRAASLWSPATASRERWSPSSNASASASRPASWPTSSPPTTPRA